MRNKSSSLLEIQRGSDFLSLLITMRVAWRGVTLALTTQPLRTGTGREGKGASALRSAQLPTEEDADADWAWLSTCKYVMSSQGWR